MQQSDPKPGKVARYCPCGVRHVHPVSNLCGYCHGRIRQRKRAAVREWTQLPAAERRMLRRDAGQSY